VTVNADWLQYAANENGPIFLGAPVCPRSVARGTLVRGPVPTGYKLMRQVPHSERGLRLGCQLKKRHWNVNERTRGKKEDQQNRRYVCSVMTRTHCRSARAFAVNPSRLAARPCGLWGLTAQRGQAKGPINAELRSREPLET